METTSEIFRVTDRNKPEFSISNLMGMDRNIGLRIIEKVYWATHYSVVPLDDPYSVKADDTAWLFQNFEGSYEPGYVYLMWAVGSDFYKIGKSKDPTRRLLQISPKMPFETALVTTLKTNYMSVLETSFHEYFANQRANGEWFQLKKQDLEFFEEGKYRFHPDIAHQINWMLEIDLIDSKAGEPGTAEWISKNFDMTGTPYFDFALQVRNMHQCFVPAPWARG